jgi:hypothetical protein
LWHSEHLRPPPGVHSTAQSPGPLLLESMNIPVLPYWFNAIYLYGMCRLSNRSQRIIPWPWAVCLLLDRAHLSGTLCPQGWKRSKTSFSPTVLCSSPLWPLISQTHTLTSSVVYRPPNFDRLQIRWAVTCPTLTRSSNSHT